MLDLGSDDGPSALGSAATEWIFHGKDADLFLLPTEEVKA
jgi:hypothetical protein